MNRDKRSICRRNSKINVRFRDKRETNLFRERVDPSPLVFVSGADGPWCLAGAVYCGPPFVHVSITRDKMIGVSGFVSRR